MSSEEEVINKRLEALKVSPDLKNYQSNYKSQFHDLDDSPSNAECLICDSVFTLPDDKSEFLSHLFNEHRLVIGDVERIASLKSYIRYWRLKFKEQPLTTYCTSLIMDDKKSSNAAKLNNDNFYFLLSDCLAEDKVLREEIYQAKLEWVLAEQVKERADTTFNRGCMFCRMDFAGSRIEYIEHLHLKHNILLGKPENLVFIDEYLDKIQNNIENFICIYCEKNFKSRLVLKEHMRKKLHKQVNPNNKKYDKYYVTNYLLEHLKDRRKNMFGPETEDPSGFSSENEDEDWSDWNSEVINITCLFCKNDDQDIATILQHMKSIHKFDFEEVTKDFTFYQKVKVVNYIRKQIHATRCVYCDVSIERMSLHMDEENHYKLPAKRVWDQPEFYFPMFESDSFLYSLDTDSDGNELT